MSDMDEARSATPPEQLRRQLMDPSCDKTEMEHWAARRIADLERERDELAACVDELRDAISACHHHACYSIGDEEALSRQLGLIRVVASDAFQRTPSASLARRDKLVAAEAIEYALDVGFDQHSKAGRSARKLMQEQADRLRRQADGGAS